MFSLIFYCGLISSVVSAHFSNDTLHDGDELDINTTLSTLASTMIPVSKDCVLEMKENEISQIVELFNSNFVNVVDIHVSFPNGSHTNQLLSDFHVSLSNVIGREILYTLEQLNVESFEWTLKVGIRNVKHNMKGSQSDCIKTRKNATDFVLESTQHIVERINLATNYAVCFSFKETSSAEVNKTCCQMVKPYLATKLNYRCPKGNSFLIGDGVPLTVVVTIMFSVFFYFGWLLLAFLSRTEFNLKYPEYYGLEESLMSPSSILLKVIWDGNGRVVSFIRSLVLMGVILYAWFYWMCDCGDSHIILNSFLLVLELCFLVFNLLRSPITDSCIILDQIKKKREVMSSPFFQDPSWPKENKRDDFEILINEIISPFNQNYWIYIVNMLYNKCLALCSYSVLAALICFVCVCILFFLHLTLATFHPLGVVTNLLPVTFLSTYRDKNLGNRFLTFVELFSIFPLLLLMFFPFLSMKFLLGFLLNIFYFLPYFAFFSVLTFYCCTYWKTMEEKYFVLKRLIYEACRETQNINNGCIPNRHPEPNEEVLLVVSKELYDKIREKLLPYDTNLFYFGLKMVWSIAFSLGIFALINMLNEFNVTGLVQVVTTASLGVMPHILNMLEVNMSEAKMKAWNENLKMNVKYMVEELIRKDPKLAQTVLIIEQDDDVI